MLMLGGRVSVWLKKTVTDRVLHFAQKVTLRFTDSGRGSLCHNSSEMKGMNGEINLRPASKQAASTALAAVAEDSSESVWKTGFTASLNLKKRKNKNKQM